MKKHPRSVGSVFVALATVAATLLAGGSRAEAGKSHMNQKPELHVSLVATTVPGLDQCGGEWQDHGLFEIGPDGQAAATAFVVPDGYRLIVTDLSWSVFPAPAGIPANNFEVLTIRPSGFGARQVYRYSTITDAAIASANVWYGQDHLTTGFSIGAGLTLCPTAESVDSGGAGANSVGNLTVQGYLIRSK